MYSADNHDLDLHLFSPKKIVVASVLSVTAFATTASARVDVANELMRSNILRADQSISADVHEHDCTVSTYMNRQAQNKDAVCKFDALLIAKKITELVPTITKVRVWFHEYKGSLYREVIVSADDLKAFETGQVTRDQLLARLRVKQAHSLKSAETFMRSRTADQSGIKTGTGVSFYFPKKWRVLPQSKSTRLLAVLSSRADLGGPDIRLSIVDVIAVATDIGQKRMIKIGYGGKYSAVEVTTTSTNAEQPVERRVYFADGNFHYKMSLLCSHDEYAAANKDFNYMLSTLHWKN